MYFWNVWYVAPLYSSLLVCVYIAQTLSHKDPGIKAEACNGFYLEDCYQFCITPTCKCPIHFFFVKSFWVPKTLSHCETWYLHNKNYCEQNKLCANIIVIQSYWFRSQWCMNGLILSVVKTLKTYLFSIFFNSHIVWKGNFKAVWTH